MGRYARLLRHLAYPDWWFWRRLPVPAIGRIERAVAESETLHCGEIRVVIEASLDWVPLLRAQSARARALEVFALERVWDTEANNGILIYLLLADRDVEIVADRGMAEVVPHAHWEAICREMEARFGAGRYENALLYGVREVGALLAAHYPRSADTVDSNELPDRPARM